MDKMGRGWIPDFGTRRPPKVANTCIPTTVSCLASTDMGTHTNWTRLGEHLDRMGNDKVTVCGNLQERNSFERTFLILPSGWTHTAGML